MYKVFVNPGHCPGIDSGAVNGHYNITEADIVYNIGTMVTNYLDKAGCEVSLLQSDNLYWDGQGECVVDSANRWPADILISLHCNAFNGAAQGTECCIFGAGGESERLAWCIQRQIVDSLHTVDRGIKERPGLIVLKHTVMPAVLVEMAFIDNDSDAELLMQKKDDFARAIARGVTDYLSQL